MRYLTTQEVAQYCQVSSVTVGKWVDAGHLRGHRTPGGHRRVARTDLVGFMRTRGMPLPLELQNAEPPVTILVADEDAPFRSLVAHRLEERLPGSQVAEAASGIEALVKAGQLRPNLVVLDVELPHLDGLQVCRRLPEVPGLEHTAILAVTRRPGGGGPSPPSGAVAAVDRSAGPEAVAARATQTLKNLTAGAVRD